MAEQTREWPWPGVSRAEHARWTSEYRDDPDGLHRLLGHAVRVRSESGWQVEREAKVTRKRRALTPALRRDAVDAIVDLVSVRGRDDELTQLARKALADSDRDAFDELLNRVGELPADEHEALVTCDDS